MLGFFPKVRGFIRHPTSSRTTAMIFVLLLLAAIPLTVIISQKQQDLRQRAAGQQICEQPEDPLKNVCLPCNYDESPDKCGDINKWCNNGACGICSQGYLNCDQTEGCEVNGNSCPTTTLTLTSTSTPSPTPTPKLETFNSYKNAIPNATDLNDLQKLLDGMNISVIGQDLNGDQYGILYNDYYKPKFYQLTAVQPTNTPTSTPTPITATPNPVTTLLCSFKPKGDANCDGVIDILDFNIWLGEFTKTPNTTLSDFNNDGIIDTRDFNIWRDNFLQQP